MSALVVCVLGPARCGSWVQVNGQMVRCEKEAGHPASGEDCFALHIGRTAGAEPIGAAWTDGQAGSAFIVVEAAAGEDDRQGLLP